MQLLNKVKSALKCKSGASIIFVLGIMMFLMAIGVSTMAAGASNAGALMRQNEFSRIRLLDKSIHDNIMFSLQADPGNEDLLGYQLAYAIFKANELYDNEIDPNDPSYVPPLEIIDDMAIIINSGGDGEYLYDPDPGYVPSGTIHVSNVAFIFSEPDIVTNPAIEFDLILVYNPATDSYEDHTPDRIPESATMSTRMTVEITITARDRDITSRAIYEYRNGRFIEVDAIDSETGSPINVMVFDENGYGTWELVSYEVIDV